MSKTKTILKRPAWTRAIRRFSDDDGAVSVEAVLWLPFFVLMVTLLADVALVFHGQARALEVAQNVNRAYSVGDIATPEEASEQLTAELASMSPNAEAYVNYEKGLITTIVVLPTSDLDAVGLFTSLASVDMSVVSQMVKEF